MPKPVTLCPSPGSRSGEPGSDAGMTTCCGVWHRHLVKMDYLSITVDGEVVKVGAGRSLAAALIGAGVRRLRRSPRAMQPRGAFCMMGVCQECLVHVDGRLEQACLTPVRPDMSVVLEG